MAAEIMYTIPLRAAFRAPTGKRAKVAVRVLREFIARHTRSQVVKISPEVNRLIWSRGIKRPPSRVRVIVEVHEEEGVKIAEVRLPKVERGESGA